MSEQKFDGKESPLSSGQIIGQLELILASRHFRQAHSLEKFLRYIVTKTLAGEEGELKEYTIGVDVFQRGRDFDPRLDTVVRVQAAHLRKKLAGYYQEEGATDEVVIEIPKGHYVPLYLQRQPEMTAISEPLTELSEAVGLSIVPPTAGLMIPPPVDAVAAESNRSQWWRMLAAFALGIAAMLVFEIWQERRAARSEADQSVKRVDPVFDTLWEKFFEAGTETILAYGTPQFFVNDGLYLRDVKVNAPADVGLKVGSRLSDLQRYLNTTLQPVEVYTGVGEAHGINTVSRFSWEHALNLNISRSRLVGWQELKNANLIFLSSLRFHTLANELGYPNDFVIKPVVEGVITNLRPQAGERHEYGGSGEHYAVVTLWPGKSANRRTMLLGGNTTWATLAAAEYSTDRESQRQLGEHLEDCRKSRGLDRHPPFFQVLVRAEVKDNQPIFLTYIAHHDLEIAPTAQPPAQVVEAIR